MRVVAGREMGGGAGPVVAILGPPAAGKSHLAEQIATRLGYPHLDIDQQGQVRSGRWTRLLDQLAAEPSPCIVESCIAPEPYREMLAVRGSYVVKVRCPRAVVLDRLRQRGLKVSERRHLLTVPAELPRQPDVVWSGAESIGARPNRRDTVVTFDQMVTEITELMEGAPTRCEAQPASALATRPNHTTTRSAAAQ